MKYVTLALTFLFGAFMIFGGVNHFRTPAMYEPFFADSLPKTALIYASGVLEIVIGLLVFIPQYRHWGTLGILALMLAFFPLHLFDVFSDTPAVGSHQAAIYRLIMQFVLIGWAWYIHRANSSVSMK